MGQVVVDDDNYGGDDGNAVGAREKRGYHRSRNGYGIQAKGHV